ncbi:MAG: ABC transporter ATP-binding protein [Clostridium sp.]
MELSIEGLHKSYGSKKALNDINIKMNSGIYGLLGENGAGKSTLMRIITTVDIQSSGKIMYNGEDIIKLNDKYRGLIGYMPQDYSVFKSFTAKDFLEYMGALKNLSQSELNKKIPEVLEFVNLSQVANKKISKFSGGMKRRIGIAQAILNDPKILILDEPTAGLDPKERIRFSNIISEMSKDKIVILSTHIVSDIEAIANDVIVIKNGSILESGKIDMLVSSIKGKVFEAIVNQNQFNKINKLTQVIHRKQCGDLIKVRYAGNEYEEVENKQLDPTLEDYYMYVCI